MNSSFSDEEIIEIIKNGRSSEVFEQLYVRIFPKIRKMIFQKGGDLDEARDIFQDAILVFYKNVKNNSYKLNTEIDGFIYVVCKNLWYNRVKKRSRSVAIENDDVFTEDNETDMYVLSEERQNAIMEIFDQIGGRCKQLLIYKLYENLSMKEITEKMQFSNENSAKTQHYKCKQKLISIVKQHEKSFRELLGDG